MQSFGAVILLTMAHTGQAGASDDAHWSWVGDAPSCVLHSVLSDGRSLKISRTPGNDKTGISIASSPSNEALSAAANVKSLKNAKWVFSPAGRVAAEVWQITDGGRFSLNGSSHDPGVLDTLSEATAVEILEGEASVASIPISAGREVVEALRSCEDKRMREWGIDAVAWRALETRPIPLNNETAWISPSDYPHRAVRQKMQGWTIARLIVNADGRVANCAPVNPDPESGFGAATCRAVKKRARFQPATISNGQAVAAPYVVVMRFALQ